MTQQPFAYTDRDYLGLKSQLVNFVQGEIPEWTADASDFAMTLIEAMAYMGDMMSYYVDLAAQESNILSANSAANVFAHAALFGYQPGLALSAETRLRFNYVTGLSEVPPSIMLTAGTKVYDAGTGLPFETAENVVVSPTEPGIVLAWEGLTRTESLGVSNGAANQRMTVPLDPGTFVDGRPGTAKVVCTSPTQVTTWLPTTNLLDHGPSDQVFALVVDSAGNASVVFGDGNSGAVPPSDMAVVLTYRQCSGATGNTVPAGAIDQWWSTYDNYDDTTSVRVLTVTNENVPAGGVNVETIDSVRAQTVKFARAQRRAVSSDDYSRVARASGAVLTAHTSAVVWSQPRVWVMPRDENLLTADADTRQALLDELDTSITALSVLGASPVMAFGQVVPVTLAVEVHVWQPVNLRTAASQVRTAILNRFAYAQADFEADITEDLVLRVIRDSVSEDVVRFAQVTTVDASALHTTNPISYPGTNQVDADATPIKGVRPLDGCVLVVRDSDLTITVRGPGKKYVDTGSS